MSAPVVPPPPPAAAAHRDPEAMTGLLAEIKRHLDTTFLVIEHDIPMIMAISDRIIAMDTGRVIAAGEPGRVRNDPAVVEAYLGGDLAAIERSGAATPADQLL